MRQRRHCRLLEAPTALSTVYRVRGPALACTAIPAELFGRLEETGCTTGRAVAALVAVGSNEAALVSGLLQAILDICKGAAWAVESTLVVSSFSVLVSNLNVIHADNAAESAPVGTPRPSRLPVVGGSRQPPMDNANVGPSYQPSPMLQPQNVGNNSLNRGFGTSLLGVPKASRRTGGPLQR